MYGDFWTISMLCCACCLCFFPSSFGRTSFLDVVSCWLVVGAPVSHQLTSFLKCLWITPLHAGFLAVTGNTLDHAVTSCYSLKFSCVLGLLSTIGLWQPNLLFPVLFWHSVGLPRGCSLPIWGFSRHWPVATTPDFLPPPCIFCILDLDFLPVFADHLDDNCVRTIISCVYLYMTKPAPRFLPSGHWRETYQRIPPTLLNMLVLVSMQDIWLICCFPLCNILEVWAFC